MFKSLQHSSGWLKTNTFYAINLKYITNNRKCRKVRLYISFHYYGFVLTMIMDCRVVIITYDWLGYLNIYEFYEKFFF